MSTTEEDTEDSALLGQTSSSCTLTEEGNIQNNSNSSNNNKASGQLAKFIRRCLHWKVSPPSTNNSSQTDPTESMNVPFRVNLICIFYSAVLILIGLLASVIETVEKSQDELSLNDWICWAIKIVYIILAIGAICCLKLYVLRKEPMARVYCTKEQPERQIKFLKVPSYEDAAKVHGCHSSQLLIWTLVLFSVPYLVNVSLNLVCSVIDTVEEGKTSDIAEVVRRVLLLVFSSMQITFLVKHNGHIILSKVSLTWWCVCQILATNSAGWFINVGTEIKKLLNQQKVTNSSICNEKIQTIERLLYPFVIEYYVIAAFLAMTILINTGLSRTLQKKIIAEFEGNGNKDVNWQNFILPQTGEEQSSHSSELKVLRSHPYMLLIGLGLIVWSLVVSVFVQTNDSSVFKYNIFYIGLAFVYACGIVFACIFYIEYQILYKTLNKTQLETPSWDHFVDRFLLWLAALAIVIHEIYSLWMIVVSFDKPMAEDEKIGKIAPLVSTTFNLCQSLLQVYVLECGLIKKLDPDKELHGIAFLNLLMMLNISLWLLNTLCIDCFFDIKIKDSVELIISSLTIPLQVFFRFHSVSCLHDFKRHIGCATVAGTNNGRDADPSTTVAGTNNGRDADPSTTVAGTNNPNQGPGPESGQSTSQEVIAIVHNSE